MFRYLHIIHTIWHFEVLKIGIKLTCTKAAEPLGLTHKVKVSYLQFSWACPSTHIYIWLVLFLGRPRVCAMHEQAVAVICWCVRARLNVHKEVQHLSSPKCGGVTYFFLDRELIESKKCSIMTSLWLST